MDIRPFEDADEPAVLALWQACGLVRPWNDPARDIARKRAVQREWFLVGTQDGRVVASAMAGYDGHRGYVWYLAVAPEARGRGFGRQLVHEVERRLLAAGCPKLNLNVRTGNEPALAFWHAMGYAQDDVVALGRRLVEDAPPAA